MSQENVGVVRRFVYVVRGGKIARFEMHVSRSEALEAAGLGP